MLFSKAIPLCCDFSMLHTSKNTGQSSFFSPYKQIAKKSYKNKAIFCCCDESFLRLSQQESIVTDFCLLSAVLADIF